MGGGGEGKGERKGKAGKGREGKEGRGRRTFTKVLSAYFISAFQLSFGFYIHKWIYYTI